MVKDKHASNLQQLSSKISVITITDTWFHTPLTRYCNNKVRVLSTLNAKLSVTSIVFIN